MTRGRTGRVRPVVEVTVGQYVANASGEATFGGAVVRVHSQVGSTPGIEVAIPGDGPTPMSGVQSSAMRTAAHGTQTEWDAFVHGYFGTIPPGVSSDLRTAVLHLAAYPSSGSLALRVHVGDVGVDRAMAATQATHAAAVAGGSAWASAVAPLQVTGQTRDELAVVLVAAGSW
jgi:hypothetical protein